MDTTKIITLDIKINPIISDPKQGEDPRLAFWNHFIKETKAPEKEPEFLEARLESSFGLALKDLFVTYLATSIKGERFSNEGSVSQSYSEPLPLDIVQFFFRAKITNYNSLNLTLAVAGMQKIAKLLDGNFDLFVMLMETFIPRAFFVESLGRQQIHGRFNFEVSVPNDAQAIFSQVSDSSDNEQNEKNEDKSTDDSKNRNHFYWLLANFSLVVPVAVAAFFVYMLYAGVLEERQQLLTSMELLVTHHELVVEQYQDRIADLQKLEEALIERLIFDLEPIQNSSSGGNQP